MVTLEFAGQEKTIDRANCFDSAPWVLSLPAGEPVRITSRRDDTELTYNATENERAFPPRLYAPEETP